MPLDDDHLACQCRRPGARCYRYQAQRCFGEGMAAAAYRSLIPPATFLEHQDEPRIAKAFALILAGLSVSGTAAAQVTTGKVIRGVTIGGAPGAPETSTGQTCDFSREETNQADKMTGASVNCRPDGAGASRAAGVPGRLNAYCVIQAPVKSARLLQSAIPGNANHCDLSGITPKDATGQFKGAVWR